MSGSRIMTNADVDAALAFVPASTTDARLVGAVQSQLVPTGQFYSNNGAKVPRLADRLLLGAAADNKAVSTRDDTGTTDWLSVIMRATPIGPYATYAAQTASLARMGTIGILGGSRTSDAAAQAALLGYTPASIGIASWGIDDDTAAVRTTSAWAYYGEAWRLATVQNRPSFAMELEAVSFGAPPTGTSNPYTPNIGGGVYTVQLGAGGGQTAGTGQYQVGDAQGAIVIVPNPTKFVTGLTFAANALTGANGTAGDTGYAEAVGMGRMQALAWHTPEVVGVVPGVSVGAFVRSTVAVAANAQRLEFTDTGTTVSNASGQVLFNVVGAVAATNHISAQSGSGAQAAGLYVNEGSGGSANLGLFPASGGELQMTSPITAPGATAAVVPAGGFLHININGTDYRIPLLSATQAGG